MFRLFQILFIDDLLSPRLADLLDSQLGNTGVYANWQTMASATEAIHEIAAGNVPDLALIDMMFGGSEDDDYVGPDTTARGIFVATALSHYSRFYKRASTFVIYTGQDKVKKDMWFLVNLPPKLNVEPILKILTKADANARTSDVEAVLNWAKKELHTLARQKVREYGVPAHYIDCFADALYQIERELRVNVLHTQFTQIVGSEIDAVLTWWENARQSLPTTEFIPTHSLREANSVGDVLSALTQVLGNEALQQIKPLQIAASHFNESSYEPLRSSTTTMAHITETLSSTEAFRNVAALFPFEAQLIQRADADTSCGDPDQLALALRQILDGLCETDYHSTLFRLLKSVNRREGEPVYLTRFAAAAHDLKDWLLGGNSVSTFPFPGGFEEANLTNEASVLPAATLQRMREHGGRMQSRLLRARGTYPTTLGDLTWFALAYGEDKQLCGQARSGWHDKWGERLKCVFPVQGVHWDFQTETEPEFLSDWGEFFGDGTDTEGLIRELLRQFDRDGKKWATVHYYSDARVSIQFIWPEAKCDGEIVRKLLAGWIDASPLGHVLHRLALWGEVEVEAKYRIPDGSELGHTKVSTISFRPLTLRDTREAEPGTPGFKVTLTLVDYLHNRGLKSACVTA